MERVGRVEVSSKTCTDVTMKFHISVTCVIKTAWSSDQRSFVVEMYQRELRTRYEIRLETLTENILSYKCY